MMMMMCEEELMFSMEEVVGLSEDSRDNRCVKSRVCFEDEEEDDEDELFICPITDDPVHPTKDPCERQNNHQRQEQQLSDSVPKNSFTYRIEQHFLLIPEPCFAVKLRIKKKINTLHFAEQQEHYFLLCDVLPEDRILREQLQQRRLEEVLDKQQKERDDTSFHRTCMFCNEEFTGNRSLLLNHMAKEHSFSIGLPDNIVYCTEFLNTLEWKLENMQCLYCEKTFRDKTTLRDHMRKKQHRRINARNNVYDRFYIINYLELGKTWEEVQSEDDRDLLEDEDDDWSDWQAHPVCAVCLFCEQQADTMDKIYTHMKETHEFDLHKLKTDLNLKFYQQVKLVNYIRRELHQCRCYGCQEKSGSKEELVQHLVTTAHMMQLPEVSHWDQPQYYFPTYENDALLTGLSDSESESEGPNRSSEVPVIAEDISNLKLLKQTSVLSKLLKDRGSSS